MTNKKNQPPLRRTKRWMNAGLGAVAIGVMMASGGAWADELPEPMCNPNKLYDILSSSFHQTAAQLADDRGWAGWGQQMGGTDNVAPPESIMGSTSVGGTGIGKAFPGVKPLLVTTGSATTSHQTVALGNDGKFYAWGVQGTVLPDTYTSSTAVAATTLELPTDISAGDVDMLFASYQFLAIVAGGNVWVLINSTNANLLGDGSTNADNDWHKVKIDADTDLDSVIAVRGQVGPSGTGAVMALTDDGDVYTWGSNIYLGDGSTGRPTNTTNSDNRATRNFATKMTLPTPVNDGKVVQIGVTGGSNSAGSTGNSANINNSYYVLFKDEGEETGELWSLGANTHRQLGDGSTTWQLSWVPVKKPANPDGSGGYADFQDVKMFSVQEHDWGYAGTGSVAAIDSIGDVYTWGSNNGNMIGMDDSGGGASDPRVQGGLLDTADGGPGTGNIKARYVEVGGHTTAYSPQNSPKFCYVGHLIAGSMGNDTSDSGNPWQFDCDRTPAVNICGADPIGAVNDSMGSIPVPDVLTKLTGNAYSNDHYRGEEADQYIGDKNNPDTSDGIFGKVLEPAQSINWGPVPYLDVATGEVYAPAGTPPGDYTIKYEICDVDFPEEICAAADIEVTILGIKAIPDTDSTTSDTPVTTPVTNNDTSPSGVPINHDSVTVVSQPPNGEVVCKGDTDGSHLESGQCQYTPNLGFKGTDTYTYKVCNTADPVECDTTTVTIAVDEPPQIVANDDSGVTSISVPLSTPVLANDIAVGGKLNPNTVFPVGNVEDGPSGATTSLSCSAGYCQFAADQPGTYRYTYKVCLEDPAATCDEAKVTVVVADGTVGNPAPTIVPTPDSDTTPLNTPVTTTVFYNDGAVGGSVNPGSVAKLTDPLNGAVSCSDGKCTYTPGNGFVGVDTYEYQICLADPGSVCGTTTVTVKVGDPSITARDDETIPGAPKDVSTNDTPTGGELDKPGIKVITPPTNGTVNCDNGVCTYTSATPENPLDDSYVYQVCLADMPDICSTATVTVKGLKVEAVDDEKILTSWDPLELTPVENDSCLKSGDSEICQKEQVTTTLYTEGETESAEWFPPKYGTVVCDGNDCIYTPNKDTFPGQDEFTYEVCLIDEPSVCDIAVVHIQGEPEMEPVLDLPPPTTGRNYPEDKPAGWLTCTNIGTDAAQNVSCEVTDLPPGLELGQCTLEGQPFPGDPVNTTVGIGKEVACPIVGKPTGEPGEPTATTGWDDPNPGSDPERREEETGVDGNPPNTRVPVLAPAAVPVDNPFALLLLALGLLGLGSHYARKRSAA